MTEIEPFFTEVVLFVICFSVASGIFYWWKSNSYLAKCCDRLPHIKQTPLVSYFIALKQFSTALRPSVILHHGLNGYCKLFQKTGVSSLWIGFRPIVFFYKAETVEALINNSFSINKSREYHFLEPWLGKGLLISTMDRWRNHRKLINPAFSVRILEEFVPTFDEQSAILVDKIESLVEKPWIDIVPLVTRCTLDIICESAMGVRMNTQSDEHKEYLKAIHEMGQLLINRLVRPWLWNDFIFNLSPSGRKLRRYLDVVHGFTKQVIKFKKESLLEKRASSSVKDSSKIVRKPFLELLLEHHLGDPSFTELDVREEVDTFLFGGHDTTAMGISWTLYSLGLYQDIQEKVFHELNDIFQAKEEPAIIPDDLKKMKYLECVIKESLRLYPPVVLTARELQGNIQVSDYTMLPGFCCVILSTTLHRDPEQFPNPEEFNPDRFLPENCLGRHPYAYLPFSAGPRNCIGQKFALMELKTVIAHIIRKFKVTSLDQRDSVHITGDIILRNAEPLRLRFSCRDSVEKI